VQVQTPGSILGHAVRRREDPRLVTGKGRYVDDIQTDRCLHVAFVRSTLAHASIRAIDIAAAATAPGVVAVFTADDLGLPARVGFHMMVPEVFARPPLAVGRVRFVGEPVALVVAESRDAAVDAAQLVGLDLEPLEAVVDPEAARHAGSELLFPAHGSNVANHFAPRGDDDVLAGAEVTVKGRFVNQRLAPVPMEPEAILVVPEAGKLAVWATSQTPFGLRGAMASSLGMAESDIRVVVGDMGGGFGAKAGARPELIVVAAAARKLGRPVKWIETRSENLVGMTHGRGQVQHV
jgi:carbon-monoxide dehydrogenase large subunit